MKEQILAKKSDLIGSLLKDSSKDSIQYAKDAKNKGIEDWLSKAKKLQDKIISRQIETETFFFSSQRVKQHAKQQEVSELKEQFRKTRTKDHKAPIELNNKSGRRLVMADSAALETLVNPLAIKKDADEILRYDLDSGIPPTQTKEGTIDIKIRYNPLDGHSGNLHLCDGIGPYGEQGDYIRLKIPAPILGY